MKSEAANAAATKSTISHEPKPRLAFAVATGFGLGYLPLTPGSWGALLGVFLAWLALNAYHWGFDITPGWMVFTAEVQSAFAALNFAFLDLVLILIFSLAGVWAAGRVEKYLHKEDPQIVVVDEIAGQLITYLALATPRTFAPNAANWKYLLLGFILFRVLDVWKPFPARQAESLPGGLGIMADDWMAGAYAALALWLIRTLVR